MTFSMTPIEWGTSSLKKLPEVASCDKIPVRLDEIWKEL
jgi:hypothetical protein